MVLSKVWRLVSVTVVVALVGAMPAAGSQSDDPRLLGEWGGFGDGEGEFEFPVGIAVGADGTVYVADWVNDRIQYFTADGDFLGEWGEFGSGDGEFSVPIAVAIASDGTVYIADRDNHRVQYFTAEGDFLGEWGSFGSGPEQFMYPSGLAIAPDGTVYVADADNDRIRFFTPDGTPAGGWTGDGAGALSSPFDVAVAPDGIVYVADSGNDRILYFTADGEPLGGWGSSGDGPGQFNSPEGLEVAPDGTVYVADAFNNRVQYFGPDGSPLGEWGSGPGDAAGEFDLPTDVDFGLFGDIYVVDHENHRIQRFAFPKVSRLAGSDRFATAAAISEFHHAFFDVDRVFVATGRNFPDALAGAVAAAASHSPLLLTGSLPGPIEAELERLDPNEVVILGGLAAVDAATESLLAGFGATTRLAGQDRFETAVAISEFVFGDGDADAVVVATGDNFPDALAAASLAAQRGGPVLLTRSGSLPGVVADEISRLAPDMIYVVGGEAAVSASVFDALAALAPGIERVQGPDRFATAVEISKAAFPDGAEVVYLAVGANFPDALTGAAQAARWGAPVLLTRSDALPASVAAEIERLDPHTIVILGGEAVIHPAVEAHLEALLAP